MKRLFLFVLFFFSSCLFAEEAAKEEESQSFDSFDTNLTSRSMPSSMVNNTVNAISGAFFLQGIDLQVPGPESLNLHHFYNSSTTVDSCFGHSSMGGNYGGGVGGVHREDGSKHPSAIVIDDSGSIIALKAEAETDKSDENLDFYLDPDTIHKGFTNCSGGEISGKTNLKNVFYKNKPDAWHSKRWTGYLGDGTILHYNTCDYFRSVKIEEEEKPNSHLLTFDYHDKDKIKKVELWNNHKTQRLGWLKFDDDPEHQTTIVSSSNGKEAKYTYYHEHNESPNVLGKRESLKFIRHIEEIESPDTPKTRFHYGHAHHKDLIDKISWPDERYLEVEYDDRGRVIAQKGPTGKDGEKRTLYSLDYHDKYTTVHDANNNKTNYQYSARKRLLKIEHYLSHKDPYRTAKFFWGEHEDQPAGKKIESDEGNLIGKAILGEDGRALLAAHYSYDENGNILKEVLWGNLTGKGASSFSLDSEGNPNNLYLDHYKKCNTYSSDGFNLLLAEVEDDGPKIVYKYKSGTNLPTARFTCDGDDVKIREFFEYDDDAVLVKKIIDDGSSKDSDSLRNVTERKIIRIVPVRGKEDHGIGQPETVKEYFLDLKTGKEIRLLQTEFSYTKAGQVKGQAVLDGQGDLLYILNFTYNENGLITSKTDPEGRVFQYEYNKNFNKTREELVGSGFYTTYEYDQMGRPTRAIEHHDDGHEFISSVEYDLMGNKIATTDHFGNETTYEYDALNRPICITYPKVMTADGTARHPKEEIEYDRFDNPIKKTDKNGNVTKFKYNGRKQPVQVTYPDGSSERFEYNLNGTAAQKWEKNGSTTTFSYDWLRRPSKVKTFDKSGHLLKTTKNNYNAFHLVSTQDPMGCITSFFYDGAGRKIEETKRSADNYQKTTFQYDCLGRTISTKVWYGEGEDQFLDTLLEYDFLNRVTQKQQKNGLFNLLSKELTVYDILGNVTKVQSFQTEDSPCTVETIYNSMSLPVKIIDELGNTSEIAYHFAHKNELDQRVLSKTTRDPLGSQSKAVFDVRGLIVSLEEYDSHDQLLSRKKTIYDLGGNAVQNITTAVINHVPDHDYVVTNVYDSMNRVIETVEQPKTPSEKKTLFSFDEQGLLKTLTKPDSVKLNHCYDDLHRLTDLSSSDKSVHYSYNYDLHDNPIAIHDHVHNITHRRNYDAWNRVLAESFFDDLTTQYSYDPLGRMLSFQLPDKTQVAYEYSGGHLSDVIRKDRTGNELYRHSYTRVDLQEHVLESRLIGSAGYVSYSLDKKGRTSQIEAPSWNEIIPKDGYDAVDNLRKLSITDSLGSHDELFDYDSLNQLTNETGHFSHSYSNDSLSNRIQQDSKPLSIDSLNRIKKTDSADFTYDKNGNLIEKIESGKKTTFRYDALDRLIEANIDGDVRAEYLYNASNLRQSKKVWVAPGSQNWLQESSHRYVYQGDREVAAFDSANNCVAFRAIGRGKGADIGAAVALEINGSSYCPTYDHRGDVCQLLSLTGAPLEMVRYSAFGLFEVFDTHQKAIPQSVSPWLFASKRYDPETEFFYFSQRYYSASIGRFITPDPLGFADGPNLYAYVHNNPLWLLDPYGTTAEGPSDGGLSPSEPAAGACGPGPDSDVSWSSLEIIKNEITQWRLCDISGTPRLFKKTNHSVKSVVEWVLSKDKSCIIRIGSPDSNDKALITVNGAFNHLQDTLDTYAYFHSLVGGKLDIYLVFNDTAGAFDLYECAIKGPTEVKVAGLLENLLKGIFEKHPYGAVKIICHSEGVQIVHMALKKCPQWMLENIWVDAFAPAEFIPKKDCPNVMHYVCLSDPVPFLRPLGLMRAIFEGTVLFLPPHYWIPLTDHPIKSAVYRPTLSRILKEHASANQTR